MSWRGAPAGVEMSLDAANTSVCATPSGVQSLCVLLTLTLAGCTVGPNYHRPAVTLPDQFREQPGAAATSLADTKFADLFHDDTLTALLNKSLQNNFDVRASAERILEARAQVGIVRANQYPFLDANASFNGTRAPRRGPFPFPPGTPLCASYTQAGASLSWRWISGDATGALRNPLARNMQPPRKRVTP